ncbi:putative baseplate assembly protein [Chitinispirillales bacterium ANBcel5]|uniref:putative baseplate assembly protein n=1 Tax=Cellulosispirillum alkaliphilum TaxID=3039283 RepID=UPI002A556EC5|nr:putative baseplate assembly protein [Chitinispirillales bacterium ANBcel5]
MSLPSMNIDDRDFDSLVKDSLKMITQSCPQWTDVSMGEPGRMLIEVFAYLTETMIYRINRLPQKAFVEFLRLLGVKLYPPKAARTTLQFSLKTPMPNQIDIPQYTRVTLDQSGSETEPPIFITTKLASIKPGKKEIKVDAFNAEMVTGELAGHGNGVPGQWVQAAKTPIIAGAELLVGVESTPEELSQRAETISYGDKVFRIWSEVESFANLGKDRYVFTADRVTGVITFTPSVKIHDEDEDAPLPALGEAVPEGREIRLWYAHGGGDGGNASAEVLNVLKDPVPGVHLTVTNVTPATGGAPTESIDNALLRGPLQFRSLERAVTADDIELVTKQISGDVSRAHAYTKIELWKYALRGTVEVLAVPSIPKSKWNSGRISINNILNQQKISTLDLIREELKKRTPLGITVLVNWVRYKGVSVHARVVVNQGENTSKLKERVLERLYIAINPIPSENNSSGWEFNSPLRVSSVYDILLAEPAVRYADNVKLKVQYAPSTDVRCIQVDSFQERMWYASSGSSLFRTSNEANGWELITTFQDEEIRKIESSNTFAGYLAVSTTIFRSNDERYSKLYLSKDCGESGSWDLLHQTAFEIDDIAWTERDNEPILLFTAESGLFELTLKVGAVPGHILVDSNEPSRGFYSVEAAKDERGISYVAVSSRRNGGIFISDRQGRAGTFSHTGLKGEDIRLLKSNQYGGRIFLWAAVTAAGTEEGKGCFRLELSSSSNLENEWVLFNKQWSGGSCFSLTFHNTRAYAGTHNAGVLALDSRTSSASWQKHSIDSGLPFRDRGRIFEPVLAIQSDQKRSEPLLLAGGVKGVFISSDAKVFKICSDTVFTETVTIPPNWLFCSGEHKIVVETEE